LSLNEEEKYFVCAINEGGELEPVIWFKTLKEAQKEAKEWKKKYPVDAPTIYVGEILFEKTKEA